MARTRRLGVVLEPAGAQPVSTPLAAERVGSCHLRSTMPLRNSRDRPARTQPNEQPRVLRQCQVARLYGSAHGLAGRASALGHSWRLPFLLRIDNHFGHPLSACSFSPLHGRTTSCLSNMVSNCEISRENGNVWTAARATFLAPAGDIAYPPLGTLVYRFYCVRLLTPVGGLVYA